MAFKIGQDPADGHEVGFDDVKDYEEGIIEPTEADVAQPFGDESTAEVKYRTMTWWYVLLPSSDQLQGDQCLILTVSFTGNVECVR